MSEDRKINFLIDTFKLLHCTLYRKLQLLRKLFVTNIFFKYHNKIIIIIIKNVARYKDDSELRENKIGLLLCHSHIELRLWLWLS